MLVPNDEAKEVESGATKVFDESSLKTNSEFVRPMILVSEEAVDVGSKNKSGEMVVQEVDKKLLKEPEVMGFTTSRATCTPHFSGNKRSLDAAMNWVVEHEFDPDIVVNSHGICKLREETISCDINPCNTITKHQPEKNDPSLSTWEEMETPKVWIQIYIQRMVELGLLMEDLFDMSYRDASESQQLILVVALISAFNHWELMNETGAGS
ncbi:hypothetical protein V6N11_066322 [Hibiscus sabdariffa]|uniref:UBA domain-containing protein n=1 Tax=Hibiscus sabdariffa TaxID=183260 RepID=A0ABR2A904_9ROSI